MTEKKWEKKYVVWYDSQGNKCTSLVLSTFSRTNEGHGLTRSWVTVWDEPLWCPVWIDIRYCEEVQVGKQ